MATTPASESYQAKYKEKNFLVRNWQRALNIGIDENTSFFNRKRIRLLNGICVIAVIAYLANIGELANKQNKIPFYDSIGALIIVSFILFLNSRKKYGASCHGYNIFNILFFTYAGIISGGADAAEMWLLPSSVTAMLFFRETRTIIIYFLVNFLCFGIVKYCNTFIPALVTGEQEQKLLFSNYFLLFIIFFLIIIHFKSENAKQENLLEVRNVKLGEEKERSEGLLLNILPSETAAELKEKGTVQAKDYEMVTVLFTDFKNFTKASELMSAQEMVNEINYCYSAFDRILSAYGVEKIKTIGDGYMAAGGLPVKNTTNPVDTVRAALDIRNFMNAEKIRREKEGKQFFDIRIGINTGPVVAGVVGIRKFAYDIWGDTVNTASRMESSGEVGKVNISGSTYELVKDKFNCTYRGKVLAKNKGEIDMYFVES